MSRAPNDPNDLESKELASVLDLEVEEISFLDASLICCVCFVVWLIPPRS